MLELAWRAVLIGALATTIVVVGLMTYWLSMPGSFHRGELPPLSDEQRALAESLRRNVRVLATSIGPRGVHTPEALAATERYLADELAGMGYQVERQTFAVASVQCSNLAVEVAGQGRQAEILVIGAHYDSAYGTPGGQ